MNCNISSFGRSKRSALRFAALASPAVVAALMPLSQSARAIDIPIGTSFDVSGGVTINDPFTINGAYNQALKVNGTLGVAATNAELYYPTGAIGAITNVSGDNTITGDILLNGAGANIGDAAMNTVGVAAGTLTLSGAISASGTGAFTKVGPGTLVLSGASPNTNAGLVRFFGGTVIAEKDGALGVPGSGTFYLGSSMLATFALRGGVNYTTAETLNFGRTYGADGKGLLDNFGGDNTFAGLIVAGAVSDGFNIFVPNSIGVTSGSLTLTNGVQGSSTTALRTLQKLGPGTLTLMGDNSFSGFISVDAGTLALKTNVNTGTGGTFLERVAAAPGVTATVKPGAAFVIDQSGGVNTNRLTATGSAVNLRGGEFGVVGHATDVSTNTYIGNIRGNGTLSISTAGAATVLDASAATRDDRQTLFVRGMADSLTTTMTTLHTDYALSGSGGAAGSSSVSIIPSVVGAASAGSAPTDFVTYGTAAATSVRVLTAGEYGALVSGDAGAPLVNALVSASPAALGATTTINSLKLAGNATSVNLGGNTLNVQSGAVLSTADGQAISNGTLNFGGEGIVHVASSAMTISAAITGANGLTKSGSGSLTLSSANTYAGDTYINGGTLIVNADNRLGSGGNLRLAGGTLQTTTGFSTARNVTVTAAPGAGGVDVPAGQTTTFAGNIDGAGALNKTGAGTLVLAGASSSYYGGTNVTGGVLSVSDGTALGAELAPDQSANIITLDGATLQFTGGGQYGIGARCFYFGYGGGTIDVSGAGTHVLWSSTGSGRMIGPGSLTKIGDGTWEFVGNTPNFAGGTFINAGTVIINNADVFPGSTPIQAVTVSGTGKLSLNGVTISNQDVVLTNGGTLTGTGAFGSNRGLTVSSTGGVLDTNGAAVIFGSGTQGSANNFAGNLQITGAGSVDMVRTNGAASVTPGASITIGAGTTFTLAGSVDALSDGTDHVDVINNSTTSFNVAEGTKNVGNMDGVGNTTVNGGVTLVANRVRQNALTVGGTVKIRPNSTAEGVSHVNTLSVSGLLDLADNKLITSDTAGTWDGVGAYNGVAGLVDTARGSAGNAMWDGTTGITTTDTRAINNGDLVSIGVAKVSEVRTVADTATTNFAGQTVLGSDTLVMATWGGDANLDGKINIDDYGRIDGNVGQSGSVFGWSKGDFNYDGKINIDDYGIIDGNINRQGAVFATSGSAGGAALDGVAAVPEPASLSLLALGAGVLMRRRRNQ